MKLFLFEFFIHFLLLNLNSVHKVIYLNLLFPNSHISSSLLLPLADLPCSTVKDRGAIQQWQAMQHLCLVHGARPPGAETCHWGETLPPQLLQVTPLLRRQRWFILIYRQWNIICDLCPSHVILCFSFRCSVCSSTLLPGCYKEGSEVGSLVCTHHLTASQNAHPDYSKQTGSIENLPKLDEQEVTLSQGGLTDNPDLSDFIGKTDSDETVIFGRGETETEGGERKTRHDTLKKPRPPRPPKPTVEEGKLEEAGTRPIQTIETLTVTPDSGSASASPGRPVPAPRRILDSTPPRPAPRTRPPKAMDSPLVSGE